MDCMNADGTSMMNAQTFSATPTPADSVRPIELTIARMTRKETPTRKSCTAMGVPKISIRRMIRPSHRTIFLRNSNGSVFFDIRIYEITTLMSWAATVAMAAPAVPMWKPATSVRSPAILKMHAISTVTSGVLESPSPLKIPPIRL